jgi:hypothetical protein
MFTASPVRNVRLVTCLAGVAASVLVQSAALGCVTPLELRNSRLVAARQTLAAASAGTTRVSGTGVFNDQCQPPVGSPPSNLGDYPPIDLSGSLFGCWYTYVSRSKFNPSGTYVEQGNETFVGCLNGSCGTFETVYTFTAKYTDDTFAQELHGRCEHRIVGGTGDFADAKGVILFKDDVVNLLFNYRGNVHLD